MEKRSMRRSFIEKEDVAENKTGRPKRTRKQVGVPATIEESPPKKDLNLSYTKMKEPTVMLRKLSPSSLAGQKMPTAVVQQKKFPDNPITTKRATRSKPPSLPVVVKTQDRISDKEERNAPSRQSTISSVSTVPTVDLTPSNEGGDTARLNDYIRRSVSRTIEAAKTIRRSLSRPPSVSTSVGISVAETESRYTRSVSRSHYDDEEDEEYSDNENEKQGKYTSINSNYFDTTQSFLCRPATIPREFGGAWGQTFLLLTVPLLTTYLVLAAGGKFALQLPKDNDYPKLIKNIFPTDVVLVYLYYHFSLFILSGILLGWKIRLHSEHNTTESTYNAFPLAVSTNLALVALVYYGKFNVVNFVLKHEWRLCIMGLVHAFVTAFWAQLRARYSSAQKEQINIYGKSGNIITDFALGRFINPRAFNYISYKQYAYRAQLITTLIIAECYLINSISWPNLSELPVEWWELNKHLLKILNLNSGAICAGILLLFYVLESIVFEHHLSSSFEMQGEGFGCLTLLRYAATPYLMSGLLRYAYRQKLSLNCNAAFFMALALLLIGLSIKRFSCALKYKYRLNPCLPRFENVESIHTYQGRRLLLGAYWGKVRQPNYAGDILALAALCLPFALKNIWQAHLGILLIIITILHRAVRVNERNHQRYYSSWMRYCQQVRYYIVPKIF